MTKIFTEQGTEERVRKKPDERESRVPSSWRRRETCDDTNGALEHLAAPREEPSGTAKSDEQKPDELEYLRKWIV